MLFHQAHNSLSNYNYNITLYTDEIWDYHFHRNLELIYVLDGAVNCTVNSRQYRLAAGEFGLCLSYDIHRYEPEKNTIYWVLVFSEEYVRFLSKRLFGKEGNGFAFRCKNAVEKLIKEELIDCSTPPSTLMLKSCLYAVMEAYLDTITLVDRSGQKNRIISFVSAYVQKHHVEKLTLSDLARELGYDYNYMSRYFHNTFNMSFSDFVNIHRLETATGLLEDTEESIINITFKSGFQSVRGFNHFFKKNTGMTPSEYRKQTRL